MNSDYAVAPESCLGAWYALAHQNLVRFKKKIYFCGELNIEREKETRTKTSIRYAKEKERERKKGTRRDIERESEL